MKTDIQIAQEAAMLPIKDVAAAYGIKEDDLELYGRYKAKLTDELWDEIKERQDIPVIFLTASDDEASVVTGLNMGADDYVTKPFRPRELVARIKAALRKGGKASSSFNIGGLLVDTASGIVKKNGSEIFLSALEYRLLLVFVSNPKSIITRDRLLNELWDAAGEFVTDNALTVYIKRLREKIEDDPAAPRIIRTVRGTGYRLGEG